MATKTLVSVEEYLSLSFDGADRDFVNGEVLERSVGGNRHSTSQAKLIGAFLESAKTHRLYVRPELRLRLQARRFRVADLAVFAKEEPTEEVPSTPPAIVVEIVSPDDRYTEIVEKLAEYRQWGVPNIWLVDPYLRKMYVFDESGLRETPELSVPQYEVRLRTEDVM